MDMKYVLGSLLGLVNYITYCWQLDSSYNVRREYSVWLHELMVHYAVDARGLGEGGTAG